VTADTGAVGEHQQILELFERRLIETAGSHNFF